MSEQTMPTYLSNNFGGGTPDDGLRSATLTVYPPQGNALQYIVRLPVVVEADQVAIERCVEMFSNGTIVVYIEGKPFNGHLWHEPGDATAAQSTAQGCVGRDQ